MHVTGFAQDGSLFRMPQVLSLDCRLLCLIEDLAGGDCNIYRDLRGEEGL